MLKSQGKHEEGTVKVKSSFTTCIMYQRPVNDVSLLNLQDPRSDCSPSSLNLIQTTPIINQKPQLQDDFTHSAISITSTSATRRLVSKTADLRVADNILHRNP